MEAYAYLMLVFNALELVCCIWLFQSFAVKRKRKNQLTAIACIIAMLAAEWIVCDMLFYDTLILKAIAVMGLLSLFMYRWFQIRYLKALVLSMLFYGVMLVADYLALVVVGTVYPGKMWDLSDFFIIYGLRIASDILGFGMVFCVKKMLGSNTTDVFSVREWCGLAAVSLITIFSVISISVETEWTKYVSRPIAVDYFHIYIIGGILCINFIGYYLIHSITERELKLREYAVFREKVKTRQPCITPFPKIWRNKERGLPNIKTSLRRSARLRQRDPGRNCGHILIRLKRHCSTEWTQWIRTM